MAEPNRAEAQVIADLVSKHIKHELVELAVPDPDSPSVLVLPSGLQAYSIKRYLDEFRTAPERRKGTAFLVELESFIEHVRRFKDVDSALFAGPDDEEPDLTAVFDYHRRCNVPIVGADGEELGASPVEGAPRFGEHRAVYQFPLADEWKAWTAQHGKPMAQGEFATWLEDRIVDVADPDGAFASAKQFAHALGIPSFAAPNRLLDLSRGLTVHVDERAQAKVNPSTGETTVFYQAEHNNESGAPLAVPRAFIIQIPVFRAGVAYQLPVRLKYRLGGGKLAWFYELHDARKAFDDAFREACERAAEATGLPLFYGSPEA
jgi:hypothetical protein